MRIAGLQFDIAWHDPEENFRRVRPLAERAVADGAELLVLPEMFATGFTMDVAFASGAAPSARAFLARLARDLRVQVVGGVADASDRTPGKGLNYSLAFDADGAPLASYRKIHPFTYGGEDKSYDAGDALALFRAGRQDADNGVRTALFVCYDLRFPEIFRAAAGDVDLMLLVANWPASRRAHWRTLLTARAIENQCCVLGVNRVGEGNGLAYSGDSLLLDPFGEVLADGAGGAEAIIAGDVSPARVSEVRERFSFLRDRRPDVYARLGAR
jgi:predicted amidohydrolase